MFGRFLAECKGVGNDNEEPPRLTSEQLGQRIRAARARHATEPAPPSSLGHAIVLFMSLGFSFAGALVSSLVLGEWLVKRTGHEYWSLIMLLVGLVSGISAVVHLLRPLMRQQ